MANVMEVDSNYTEYIPLKERRRRALEQAQLEAKQRKRKRALLDMEEDAQESNQDETMKSTQREQRALVDINADMLKQDPNLHEEDEEQKQIQAERDVMRGWGSNRTLQSAGERALGIKYMIPMKSSWTPPHHIAKRSEARNARVRKKWAIQVVGNDIPPPIDRFQDMRLPPPILYAFKEKKIKRPTPIQIQGLPVALSGRDMIGIAFTGSGKTIAFALPMIMFALEQELRMKLLPGEGPVGLTICPSRELCVQTHGVIDFFCTHLHAKGYPQLRTLKCMGGISMQDQHQILRNGPHMVCATPGRLLDMLSKKKFNLEICTYLCLDEADRLIDFGFDEDIRSIFSFFKRQRQTVMFSATMPAKIKEFAETSLVDPITVNVGRAGAANLDVIQEVEYVKQEAKIVYLLECLKKTAPPVLIFCSNQSDVDDVHEYLLLKGVEAVSVHAGKDQEERQLAVMQFKKQEKDVLVATDVASKGLDFPDIQHVINYDMPKEIEDYVHRIGRTGRCGKTGVATTFINRDSRETVLLDLKHLLIEAKQKIPPVLSSIYDPHVAGSGQFVDGIEGCAHCGGLGHRIINCPKLAQAQRGKNIGGIDDNVGSSW